MSLPCCRRRALDRIEQALVTEDPGLGLRFAVFARLTLHEAIPGTEQVQSRLQRLLGPAIRLQRLVISLVALLAVSGLMPWPGCPVARHAAAAGMPSGRWTAHCQSGR